MNSIIKSCVSGMVVFSLAGCANVSNQDMGTVGGAVLGGLIGSQFGGGVGQAVAIGGGMVLGAMLGSKIGQAMDEVDRMKMCQVLESNRTNQTTTWVNPDNGNQYAVTPKKPYTRNRRLHRKYTIIGTIDGKQQVIEGKAYRTPDGRWHAVS